VMWLESVGGRLANLRGGSCDDGGGIVPALSNSTFGSTPINDNQRIQFPAKDIATKRGVLDLTPTPQIRFNSIHRAYITYFYNNARYGESE